MQYARVVGGVVVEIVQPVPGFTINETFVPEIVATLVPLPDVVEVGWTLQSDGTYAASSE